MADKATNVPASPIIFTARGLVPDVRLNVFGTMMHVHSTVLKMHSQFFFSFLDAPDSATPVAGTAFKYDWTTKVVDKGRDWQLVSNNNKAGGLALPTFKGEPETQTRAFHNLLCAMYSLRYTIESAKELITMTGMARLYAALPILSRSLSTSLLQSKRFLWQMEAHAKELLIVAKELRHAELFSDCFLLSLGPWRSPFRTDIKDPELEELLRARYTTICVELAELQQMILTRMGGLGPWDEADSLPLAQKQVEIAEGQGEEHHCDVDYTCLPCLYRDLWMDQHGVLDYELKACIEPLLENNLIFPTGRKHECYFLFMPIRDNQLPWDRTQTDW